MKTYAVFSYHQTSGDRQLLTCLFVFSIIMTDDLKHFNYDENQFKNWWKYQNQISKVIIFFFWKSNDQISLSNSSNRGIIIKTFVQTSSFAHMLKVVSNVSKLMETGLLNISKQSWQSVHVIDYWRIGSSGCLRLPVCFQYQVGFLESSPGWFCLPLLPPVTMLLPPVVRPHFCIPNKSQQIMINWWESGPAIVWNIAFDRATRWCSG